MPDVLSLHGTPAHAAVKLQRTILGVPGTVMIVLALMVIACISLYANHAAPFVLSIVIAAFFRHAVRVYFADKARQELKPLPKGTKPNQMLALDLVRSLVTKNIVSSGDLFVACVQSKRGAFLLTELGIDTQTFLGPIRKNLDLTVSSPALVAAANDEAVRMGETRVDANAVFSILFRHVESCKQLLRAADISDDDLNGLLKWEQFHHRFRAHESAHSPASIRRSATIGRSWVTGYTNALDALTSEIDCAPHASGEHSVTIHNDAIQSTLRLLVRNKRRNILLLGGVGVGKKTLIQNLACALRSYERETHAAFTRVLLLRTEKLLNTIKDPAAFFYQALSRAQSSGRIVLVIKDFSTFLRSASENLKAVLLKCLESDAISIVAVADTRDYHNMVKNDAALDAQFEKVTLEDATDDETMAVMMAHYFTIERGNVHITYKALKSIIELSKRYLGSRGGFPGKAIEVMDESILRAAERGHALVTEEHVRETISAKSKVNIKRMDTGERERLLNLDEVLRGHIIGQNTAIKAVTGALKRARIELADRKRPVGTFLFLGPTGVGKTQTAKALAEEYFGSVDAMIRLDMNEFSHADSVNSIIGTGDSEGFLAQRVQDKPFSLILLDEIEKAHPAVLNVFLQILDEGFLTDARGMRTDFRNTIIIATSNAGALFIRDFVRDHKEYGKEEFKSAVLENVMREKLFAPEFINRFDETVLFQPLSQESAREVAMLMLSDIISDIEAKRGITVTLDEDVLSALVERGYSVQFGAREMRRTITDMIEDFLADYMLRNSVKRGDAIHISAEDLKPR